MRQSKVTALTGLHRHAGCGRVVRQQSVDDRKVLPATAADIGHQRNPLVQKLTTVASIGPKYVAKSSSNAGFERDHILEQVVRSPVRDQALGRFVAKDCERLVAIPEHRLVEVAAQVGRGPDDP